MDKGKRKEDKPVSGALGSRMAKPHNPGKGWFPDRVEEGVPFSVLLIRKSPGNEKK